MSITDEPQEMNITGTNVIIPESTSKAITSLIDFKNVPQQLMKEFWEFFNNNMNLSFVTNPEDESILLREFNILKIDYCATLDEDDYTWEVERLFSQMEHAYRISLLRAKGTHQKIWNERMAIAMQINENVTSSNTGLGQTDGKKGLFSNIFR